MIAPETALAICRLCFYAAVIGLYGSACFRTFITPSRLGQEIGAEVIRSAQIAGLVAFLASLAWLPCEAAVVGGGWPSALDGSTLSALAFSTMTGTMWLARVTLALLNASVLANRSRPDTARVVLPALLLSSLALSGHTQMDDGLLRLLHILNHVLHLLSGGFWLGSLLVLPTCLARLRDPGFHADTKIALRRFSSAGHIAVALVIATGVLNTWLILGRWPTDLTSSYQLLLDAKIALVLGMTSLAIVNRYVFVPRFREEPEQSVANIRRGTLGELCLGVGVLALVAVFGLMDPS